MRVATAFRLRVLSLHTRARTDRRNLNNLTKFQVVAGIEERRWRLVVDRFRINAGTALQNPGAVHHRVETGKTFNPDPLVQICHEITGNGIDERPLAPKGIGISHRSRDAVSGLQQGRHEMAPNKTISAGQQNFHSAWVPSDCLSSKHSKGLQTRSNDSGKPPSVAAGSES